MAVKVEIKTREEAPYDRFPLLRRSKEGGFTVMFLEENTGVVLDDPNNSWGVGHTDKGWVDCDSPYWEPIGSITLESND